MTTPQQQIIDKTKACYAKAKELYGLDLERVSIRFDLVGRVAGYACRRGGQYFIRYNHDMLHREAFDHLLNATAPHEVAHIVCFMNPALGKDHNSGWERVCKALGGTGATRHKEDVIYGKGHTYEYTTDRGHKVRVGDKYHRDIQGGLPLHYRKGLGTITKACAYSIVGAQGRTFATPVVRTPVATVAPVQATINPVVTAARTSFTIGVPAARIPAATFAAGNSKASISRAIMLAGHTRNLPYEDVIAAMMAACGYDRQLARATYKANANKVGIPVQ